MKPKREIMPTLTLAQNFRLAMSEKGLTFKDVARRARVSLDTAYRLAERKSPKFVTEPTVRVGRVLGFTRKQIRDHIHRDKVESKRSFTKKETFYRLIGELVNLFDLK